jgi:hypothetical protein
MLVDPVIPVDGMVVPEVVPAVVVLQIFDDQLSVL